jgi:hypothetical protein
MTVRITMAGAGSEHSIFSSHINTRDRCLFVLQSLYEQYLKTWIKRAGGEKSRFRQRLQFTPLDFLFFVFWKCRVVALA